MTFDSASPHASSFETTASSGLLRMRLSGTVPVEAAATHAALILRSPPKAGVSKDGRGNRSQMRFACPAKEREGREHHCWPNSIRVQPISL